MQIVVAQCDGAQNLGVGDQEAVFVLQITDTRRGFVGKPEQPSLCGFVVAVRCGEAGLQKLGSARVSADHVVDLGAGHGHLCRGLRVGARADRPVNGQAVMDASKRLFYTVVGGADQVYVTE
jgi:hypothetical protein